MATMESSSQPAPSRLARLESWLEEAGDRLNSILVKSARQSMQSRQFSRTFMLVLLAILLWSFYGLSFRNLDPDAAIGPKMFIGYFIILAFPLLVTIPSSAFGALSGEFQDQTFELLSITTLTPRQIVFGNLATAMLQQLLFTSALMPCLAFTFLLRGIDIVTILVSVGYLCLLSLGLTILALLVATLTTTRFQQSLLSAVVAIGLFFCFLFTIQIVSELFLRSFFSAFKEGAAYFYLFTLSNFASLFALVFLATAARLTFATDNRATALRIAMLVQSAVLAGTFLVAAIRFGGAREIAMTYFVLVGLFWYALGVFVVGESSELSLRVRRQLPRTRLGQIGAAWFFPGPARGYFFVLTNLLTALALALVFIYFRDSARAKSISDELVLAATMFSYVAVYLGVLYALIKIFPSKATPSSRVLPITINMALILVGCVIPSILDAILANPYGRSYSLFEIFNPFVTLSYAHRDPTNATVVAVEFLMWFLAGVVVFLMGRQAIRELRASWLAAPQRVLEDEAQKNAAPPAAAADPWAADAPG
ncbi:MAG TPA: hypothetical protein VFE24_08500 [Pirellulales bacterium]|jgi:hypothetical protein|nr:hypothetical protein [Pirellulales bacterium]